MHWPTRRPAVRWLVLGVVIAAVAATATLHVHRSDVGSRALSMDMHGLAAGPFGRVTPAVPGSSDEHRFLAAQTSNACSLMPSMVMSSMDGMSMQGSCCSAMDMGKYTMQVESLRQYASVSRIPQVPYDIRAPLAKQLLADDVTIRLNRGQQDVYDAAMTTTVDKGPCCCHCWRWNAIEGLAKYLISDQRWNASQVARVVSLVNGCGGST